MNTFLKRLLSATCVTCLGAMLFIYSDKPVDNIIDVSNDCLSDTATLYAGVSYVLANNLVEHKFDYIATVSPVNAVVVTSSLLDADITELNTEVTDNSEQTEEQETTANIENNSKIMYVSVTRASIRKKKSTSSKSLKVIYLNYSVKVIEESGKWYRVQYDEIEGYIKKSALSDDLTSTKVSWKSEKLNRRNGIVSGPSGHETYYNLDMSFCVNRMHRLGYNLEYWVRDDGVKMFGPYVMVAADFSQRPLGTVLPSTRGLAMVVDTGGFVNWDSTRLDVAVTW